MFKKGDKVKVKDSVEVPTGGWGKVKRGDVGTVACISEDLIFVRFPAQKGWTTTPECLELVREGTKIESPFATNYIAESIAYATEMGLTGKYFCCDTAAKGAKYLNRKEEEISMELITKYYHIEDKKLDKEKNVAKKKIEEADGVYKIIQEANVKISGLRKGVPISIGCCRTMLLDETVSKLEALDEEYSKKRNALSQKCELAESQLALGTTYEQKEKILKEYGILNKKGIIEGEN